MYSQSFKLFFLVIGFGLLQFGCSKKTNNEDPPELPDPPPQNQVDVWLTTADRISLLRKQPGVLAFAEEPNNYPFIDIQPGNTYQSVDGFGFTLTGSSALLLHNMGNAERATLLQELFGSQGISISYLRVSLGASDLSPSVFSYNDLPPGETDTALVHFSLADDLLHLVPILQEIISIQPGIQIMASPWSPPVWMKDNGSSIGGSLLPEYYGVYAKYFVKYIQAMKALGIPIHAVTVQNEPQHGGNNPSLLMTAPQQADFVKNHLGPAFRAANLQTKIIIWDHNCDNPHYPISILNDPDAKQYIDGSAFHLYNGDISALSTVRNAHPDKNLYFTEQWTSGSGSFAGDLKWHIKNVIIGSMRNWSRVALEWNLANDPGFGPHTPGGCTECQGALTLNGSGVAKNVAYYIVAHASKFVPPGSVRIESNQNSNIPNVAFKTPQGKYVLIALNESQISQSFKVRMNHKWFTGSLPPGAVATYIW